MNPHGDPRTVWLATAAKPSYVPLNQDLSVEVGIVGGGITGLTAAALLAGAGKSVALLEADVLGGGVSGQTTAELDVTTDAGLSRLVSNYGERGAKLTIEAGRKAIELIEHLSLRHGIACELRRVPSYTFTESAEGFTYLEAELEAAQRIGLGASLVSNTPLPFEVKSALVIENQGRLHPLRYLYGLARAIAHAPCRIFERTRVLEVEEGEPCRLRTEMGTVSACEIILATHSPIGLRLAIHTRVAPYRSYVLGLRVSQPVPEGIYWDTAEPYHYLRRHSDRDARLLLIGGADHKTGQQENPEACYRQLEAYAQRRFDIQSIEYRWSAQAFVPVDDLPYIGLDPLSKHTYVATGYGGTGMTLGTVAGMMIADRILGYSSPADELFSPARVNPVSSARRFVAENLNVAKQYVLSWLSGAHEESLERIGRGEGKILELEGRKVAVYRDEAGLVHALSPICPHARCIVAWNEVEQSWDCPCHGSRFQATGEVIDGPAMQGLEPLEQL